MKINLKTNKIDFIKDTKKHKKKRRKNDKIKVTIIIMNN